MMSNPHNPMSGDCGANSGEDTLRLIAGLPAPAGLEERVHEALRAAPRKARVLAWPAGFRSKFGFASGTALESNWMRAAAAAAIVFVVVGGGWGVYTRVEPGQAGKVVVMPLRSPSSGGFQGAGAIRTPETLPKDREQGNKGTREQEGPPAKKAAGPKKSQSSAPAARQVAPETVVSQ